MEDPPPTIIIPAKPFARTREFYVGTRVHIRAFIDAVKARKEPTFLVHEEGTQKL